MREPLIHRGESLTSRDGVAASLLLAFSALVQSTVLSATPAFNGDQVIFGAPVADAWFWHHLAAEMAVGGGIDTPLRPFYSILLALLFQFAGTGLAVAKSVNVVLASASVAVSYLVFRLFAPVSVAATFAAVLATSPQFVLFSHSLLSEHAGLLFSMVGLLGMLLALDARSRRWWVLAGVATGFSNLARPLTLLATPFVAAAAMVVRGRQAIKPLVIYFTVFAVTLAPWIIHQHIHYRIWSLSSNTMEALYAATSPKYGAWTGREAADLIKEGAIDPGAKVAHWNRIYARRVVQNLKNEPQFWAKNTLRMLWRSLNYPGLFGGPWRLHGFGGAKQHDGEAVVDGVVGDFAAGLARFGGGALLGDAEQREDVRGTEACDGRGDRLFFPGRLVALGAELGEICAVLGARRRVGSHVRNRANAALAQRLHHFAARVAARAGNECDGHVSVR